MGNETTRKKNTENAPAERHDILVAELGIRCRRKWSTKSIPAKLWDAGDKYICEGWRRVDRRATLGCIET